MKRIPYHQLIFWKRVVCYILFICLIGIFIVNNFTLFTHNYFVDDNGDLVFKPIIVEDIDMNIENSCPKDTSAQIVISDNPSNTSTNVDYADLLGSLISTDGHVIDYFTFILAALTLVAAIGIGKYYKKYITIEERIHELDNSVLDAALMTIHAVPFVSATQITSSEYFKAIRHISTLVSSKQEIVNDNPKYALLLLCQGLHSYFEGDYLNAITIMERAKESIRFTEMGDVREMISFHLSRAYKQFAYTLHKDKTGYHSSTNSAIQTYMDKAIENSKMAPVWIKTSLEWSNRLVKELVCYEYYLSLDQYIEESLEDPKLSVFDRMTIIPTYIDRSKNKINDKILKLGNEFLDYIEERINSVSGPNIRCAWYFSSARISLIFRDYYEKQANGAKKRSSKQNNQDEAKKYENKASKFLQLTHEYYLICMASGIPRLFIYDCLSEISVVKFNTIYESELKKLFIS